MELDMIISERKWSRDACKCCRNHTFKYVKYWDWDKDWVEGWVCTICTKFKDGPT